ncbi:hypothetical protein MBLNU230_g5619t1 [Neophaeotheca triangularis]
MPRLLGQSDQQLADKERRLMDQEEKLRRRRTEVNDAREALLQDVARDTRRLRTLNEKQRRLEARLSDVRRRRLDKSIAIAAHNIARRRATRHSGSRARAEYTRSRDSDSLPASSEKDTAGPVDDGTPRYYADHSEEAEPTPTAARKGAVGQQDDAVHTANEDADEATSGEDTDPPFVRTRRGTITEKGGSGPLTIDALRSAFPRSDLFVSSESSGRDSDAREASRSGEEQREANNSIEGDKEQEDNGSGFGGGDLRALFSAASSSDDGPMTEARAYRKIIAHSAASGLNRSRASLPKQSRLAVAKTPRELRTAKGAQLWPNIEDMRLKKGKKSPNGPGPLGGGGTSAKYDQLTSAKGKGRKKKATEDEKDADFVPDKRSPKRRKTGHASKAAREEETVDQGDSEP